MGSKIELEEVVVDILRCRRNMDTGMDVLVGLRLGVLSQHRQYVLNKISKVIS